MFPDVGGLNIMSVLVEHDSKAHSLVVGETKQMQNKTTHASTLYSAFIPRLGLALHTAGSGDTPAFVHQSATVS